MSFSLGEALAGAMFLIGTIGGLVGVIARMFYTKLHETIAALEDHKRRTEASLNDMLARLERAQANSNSQCMSFESRLSGVEVDQLKRTSMLEKETQKAIRDLEVTLVGLAPSLRAQSLRDEKRG